MKLSRIKQVSLQTLRRGFTLVELMVAMAITAILVLIIMQMTSKGIDIWKSVADEVATHSRARVALRTMVNDFESMQMRLGDNENQWFFAKADNKASQAAKHMDIPLSSQCVFFTSAFDRNPSVSSNEDLQKNYRTNRAHNIDTQGDVNAVSYRLLFRDQILNVDGTGRKERGAYPLFALYRQLISPRDAFEKLMGTENLETAYGFFENQQEEHFLCENIVEMNLIVNIEYAATDADVEKGRVFYDEKTIPIVSTKTSSSSFKLFGDKIEVDGVVYPKGRIASVNISVTVVTEEGMNLINQVRMGARRAPARDEFFRKYTKTYANRVTSPYSF